MKHTGLEKGVWVIRLCEHSSRIGAIHPWRRAVVQLIVPFLFVSLYTLNLLGRFAAWVSDLECWTENCADWWRSFVESDREMEVHRRAWKRAHKPTKETEAAP